MTESGRYSGRVRDTALDWLLQMQAAPDDAALRRGLEDWLAEDEAHVEAYRRAEETWRLTGYATPAFVAPRKDREPAPGRGESRAPSGAGRSRPGRRQVAVAGLLAACLALVVALPDAAIRLRADHATGVGEVRTIGLTDGSTVTLNAGSTVATRLTGIGRAVTLLDGQAYFEVAADRRRPFTVAAGGVTVTVTGTAFDVRRGEGTVTVAVGDGRVEVATAGGARHVVLRPGERATFAGPDAAPVRDRVPLSHIAAWRTGRLIVERVTVAEAIARIRPHHRGVILATNEELLRRRVSGVYDLRHPEAALRAAVQPHGGVVRRFSPWLLVVSGG